MPIPEIVFISSQLRQKYDDGLSYPDSSDPGLFYFLNIHIYIKNLGECSIEIRILDVLYYNLLLHACYKNPTEYPSSPVDMEALNIVSVFIELQLMNTIAEINISEIPDEKNVINSFDDIITYTFSSLIPFMVWHSLFRMLDDNAREQCLCPGTRWPYRLHCDGGSLDFSI